jgi:outer membrane protein insertion porin family
MSKQSGVVCAALLLLCALPLLAAKKPPPRAIRFEGAPQYTQQELLAAAGLAPGARIDPREVKAHARLLNDTGLFAEVKFTTDAKSVLFTLTPTTQLFPLHLDNLPLKPGKYLDLLLHEQFPLYRGLLPATGSLLENIRQAFERLLAAKGVKATVKAALTSGLGSQKLTAINFTIAAPPVRIGPIHLSGVSSAMQPKTVLLVLSQTGNAFDTEGTPAGLQHAFEDLYQGQGYAAVQVNVAQVDPPIVSDQSIDIPFAVTISEGAIYQLGTINFPSTAPVARADVDRILARYPAGSGRPLDLFLLAVRDAHHAIGYLDCAIVSHASFNEATHIVNYSLEIAPGPQYRLSSVTFDGAPDAIAARLKLAWKMAPGDVFDESYPANFAAQAQKKDKPMAKWLQTVITTYDIKPDPATHQVACTFHFAKATPPPR